MSERIAEREQNSRDMNPACGCEARGGLLFRCRYHEGASDGYEAATADMDELLGALQPVGEIIASLKDAWEHWDEDRSKLGVYLNKPQMEAILAVLARYGKS